MITNELIREILTSGDDGFKLHDGDLKPYVYERVRAVIAIAQQVRLPMWIDDEAVTPLGKYAIRVVSTSGFDLIRYDHDSVTFMFNSKDVELLKRVAQDDFKTRSLSNLVHGDC